MKKGRLRKIINVHILLLIVTIQGLASGPSSITYTEGTLYYTVQGDSATITGCFGHDAEVHVPAIIAGTPVNTIAAGAFTENEYVRTLYLPDTITKVERGAIGDWIKVIYNANTDHPQETPTELILRNQDPEPETTEQEAKTPEETSAEPASSEPETVPPETVPATVPETAPETEALTTPETVPPASASAETSQAAASETVPSETDAPAHPSSGTPAASEPETQKEAGHLVEEYPPTSRSLFWIIAPLGAAAAAGLLLVLKKKKKH